ncbi:hypothetical protein EVAR_47108_1 [Eumeta japonica]|uniref:Uncharacterized protein n=1 Tax=Eumeta variegata TaxID=151549 RepID=A0A4C1YBW2_EUMVA|nr:hypothetical protein EVAR_47108_1 [Eumeta japonica]
MSNARHPKSSRGRDKFDLMHLNPELVARVAGGLGRGFFSSPPRDAVNERDGPFEQVEKRFERDPNEQTMRELRRVFIRMSWTTYDRMHLRRGRLFIDPKRDGGMSQTIEKYLQHIC